MVNAPTTIPAVIYILGIFATTSGGVSTVGANGFIKIVGRTNPINNPNIVKTPRHILARPRAASVLNISEKTAN